jgi:hypothetical protein
MMKTSLIYLLCFCCLAAWPLSGRASVALETVYLLPDSFDNCAQSQIPGQVFDWRQIKAGQDYCLAMDLVVKETPHNSLALLVSALGASRLYLDGQLIASNGQPVSRVENEIPGQIEFLYHLPTAAVQIGTHSLRMQLSTQSAPQNFMQYLYALELIDSQTFLQKRQQQHLLTLLLCGALLMAGALVAVLGISLGRYRHWLVFSLLALVTAGLLIAESWRSLFGYLYPLHYVRLQVIWVLAFIFSALLPIYFLFLYRISLPRYLWPVMVLLFVINYFLPLSQDGKVLLLMLLGLLLSLLICILAFYHQRKTYLNLLILCLALGLYVCSGWYFAEQGFVWVVLLLMLPLLYQLIRQWVIDQRKAEFSLQLENQLLHKSLQPHFLMNCLTMVNELQRENPMQAEQFIQALSEEFRLLNQHAGQPLISLAQEIHLCRNYLELMAIRLQQSHQLHVIGESDVAYLPPASLLVLLENAFSHNKYAQAVDFVVELRFAKEKITINIRLPLGSKRQHQGSGTGMAYLQRSMQHSFDGKAKVVSTMDEKYWLVCIELPL